MLSNPAAVFKMTWFRPLIERGDRPARFSFTGLLIARLSSVFGEERLLREAGGRVSSHEGLCQGSGEVMLSCLKRADVRKP